MPVPLRLRTAIPAVIVALALPAQASAHGRGATIALDYRLALDQSVRALPGVHVRVLDGDRDLQVRADRGVRLVVLGALREPLLRIDSSGVWVNASSPTATGDRLVSASKRGWVHVDGGRTDRLARPPAGAAARERRPGPAGRFAVPVAVNGRPAAISGTFFRVARPAVWPWLLGDRRARRRHRARRPAPALRGALTVGLGVGVRRRRPPARDDVRRARLADGRRRLAPARRRDRRRRSARRPAAARCAAVHACTPPGSSGPSRRRSASARSPSSGTASVISLLPGTAVRVLCVLAIAGGRHRRRPQLPARLRRARARQEAAAAMRRLLAARRGAAAVGPPMAGRACACLHAARPPRPPSLPGRRSASCAAATPARRSGSTSSSSSTGRS